MSLRLVPRDGPLRVWLRCSMTGAGPALWPREGQVSAGGGRTGTASRTRGPAGAPAPAAHFDLGASFFL